MKSCSEVSNGTANKTLLQTPGALRYSGLAAAPQPPTPVTEAYSQIFSLCLNSEGESTMRKVVALFCVMAFATAGFAGGDLDEFKGKAITVVFVAGKQKIRENAVEQIQGMVGNPVKRSFVSSLNQLTKVSVSPVDDPKAFVEKLKEIGKILKAEKGEVHVEIDPKKIKTPQSDVSKDSKSAIEIKSDKGTGEITGTIAKADLKYRGTTHKLYHFDMEAGKKYTIEMKSTKMLCVLFAEDPTALLVARSAPTGGICDTKRTVTAAATGKYRIIASHFGLSWVISPYLSAQLLQNRRVRMRRYFPNGDFPVLLEGSIMHGVVRHATFSRHRTLGGRSPVWRGDRACILCSP